MLAVAMGLALGLAGAAIGQAAAQTEDDGPSVLPSSQITTDPTPIRAHTQPEIVVHPDDSDVLAMVEAQYFAGTCNVHISQDGGQTWVQRDARPQPGDPPICARPAFGAFLDLDFASDGTLYFAGTAAHTIRGAGSSPYVARSEDLGESWDFTVLAPVDEEAEYTGVDGETSTDIRDFGNTRLATHPTDPDIVYAGYRERALDLDGDEAPSRTFIAVSRDGGETWGELIDPFANIRHEEMYGSDQPGMAVAPDGTVHAFTKERPDPDADHHPRLLMSTSTDDGETWEGRVLTDDVAICGPCLTTPEAAIDPDNGHIYVVFELSESDDPPRANRDIWVKRSTDGGETFEERVRLNDGQDPDRDPDNNQMFPGIDIAPNGRVDVVWFDFRSDRVYNPEGSRGTADHRGDLYWDVYYTYSTDGGDSWAPNVRVSDRSNHREHGYAMHPQYHLGGPVSVASTDERAHVTWSDSRAGNPEEPAEDAYSTAVVHGASAPAGPTLSVLPVAVGGFGGLVIAGVLLLVVGSQLRRTQSAGPVTPAPAHGAEPTED